MHCGRLGDQSDWAVAAGEGGGAAGENCLPTHSVSLEERRAVLVAVVSGSVVALAV